MDSLARWDGIFGEGFCDRGIHVADLRRLIVGYVYAPFIFETHRMNMATNYGSKYSLADMFDRTEFTIHYRFPIAKRGPEHVTFGLFQQRECDRPNAPNPCIRVWNDGVYHVFDDGYLSNQKLILPEEGEITMRVCLRPSRVHWIVGTNPPISRVIKNMHLQDFSQTFVNATACRCFVTII